jgi:hypothetical protein
MAVFTAASLGTGLIPDTVGAIYTATGPTVIRAFNLFNTNAAAQTINLYITEFAGTRRQLYRSAATAQYARIPFLGSGECLILSTGDTIDADTTTASAVAYYLGGAISV